MIVVAVDGSEISIRAAAAGLDLLGNPDDVLIVTVVDAGDAIEVMGTGIAGGTVSAADFDKRERARETAGTAIVTAAAAALEMPAAEIQVLRGDPARKLCQLASERSARGIVIGSRGRGGLKRALLGSVSDFVVRNAPCPVVVSGATGSWR